MAALLGSRSRARRGFTQLYHDEWIPAVSGSLSSDPSKIQEV